MISFLIMLGVIWMVARFIGVLSCPAPRGRWALHGFDREGVRDALQPKRPLGRERGAIAAPARAETPLEKLQRDFAQGKITVEQYEQEVGKLFGVREHPPLDGPM